MESSDIKKKKGCIKLLKRIWPYLILVLSAVIFCGILCAFGVFLNVMSRSYSDSTRTRLLTIYSSVAGGFCTIVGVFVTIWFSKLMNKRNIKEKNTPSFTIPTHFDLADASYLDLCKYSDEKTKRKRCIYLKNSDKCGFYLERVALYNDENLVSHTFDTIPFSFYVDKKSLLGLKIPLNKECSFIKFYIKRLSNERCAFVADIKKHNIDFMGDIKNVCE